MKASITIITPTFNAEKTIKNCVESVLSQKYDSIEYLIVDGLSTDKTLDIVKSYRSCKVRIISEKDDGIYDAINKGIKIAKGDWIYIIGADDKLSSTSVISDIFDGINSNEIDMIYGNVLHKTLNRNYNGEFDVKKLLKCNICHQSIFAKKVLIEKHGGFDTDYKTLADYVLNLRIFGDRQARIKYTDLVIAEYSGTGLSSIEPDLYFYKNQDKLFRKHLHLSLFNPGLIEAYNFQFQHFKKKKMYLKILQYGFLVLLMDKKYLGKIWDLFSKE
jgi:glycosyltransferase involved in cell wall biosynthesis